MHRSMLPLREQDTATTSHRATVILSSLGTTQKARCGLARAGQGRRATATGRICESKQRRKLCTPSSYGHGRRASRLPRGQAALGRSGCVEYEPCRTGKTLERRALEPRTSAPNSPEVHAPPSSDQPIRRSLDTQTLSKHSAIENQRDRERPVKNCRCPKKDSGESSESFQ
eukprot:Amastigsp_a182866_15.p1 type:complete len:171 gc:universal Amastigsp_a182866_15:331-843(+)